MADLATTLLRTVTRTFYSTDHVLVLDALLMHSALSDSDLALLMGMQGKAVRKLLGKLKEDGILSATTRQERRTDGSAAFFPGSSSQPGKERLQNKEWYYINYHRAIDSIKYRLFKLSAHFSALGLPTTEKKDLSCPQCKSQWTELEVMHNLDFSTGDFLCARCNHPLDPVPEEDRNNENESLKRLNSQLEKIHSLMQQLDAATVPENDYDTALANAKPIKRTDANPAQRIETVDIPNNGLQSSKGLALAPEKIAVSLHSEEDMRRDAAEAEKKRREKEAGQNALPEWIAKSTVSGEVTGVGAKEEARKREMAANGGVALKGEEDEEKKPVIGGVGGNVDLDAYWAELEKAKVAEEQERANGEKEEADEDDDDDDEDDFADVEIPGVVTPALPASNGSTNGSARAGLSTPALTSSNANTDDEDGRAAKRQRLDVPTSAANGGAKPNGVPVIETPLEGTPAASDEDEDELEFENV
ncbi:hypothetical protein LTS10_001190 [Elasticomyces elasticus]|nr:hypothetical protein LTS10_001190 [Elasticomyces elasticus]